MKNYFEVRGEIVIIFLNSEKYGAMETLIDLNDLPNVMKFEHTWYPQPFSDRKEFYAAGKIKNKFGKRTTMFLHRWITSAPDDIVVDHKNHKTLDNRKTNLRLCSISENTRNQRNQTNKSSIFKGVHFDNNAKKFRSQIYLNCKRIHLGLFQTEYDAAKAYNEAAIQLFGDFAKLNDLYVYRS